MDGGITFWLVLRRLILPVIVSALIAPYAIFLATAIVEGDFAGLFKLSPSLDTVAQLWIFAMLFTGPAILLIGLPAGWAVARLHTGIAGALVLLTVIGATAGWLIVYLFIGDEGASDTPERMLLALWLGVPSGGSAASIWTLFNRDLFARPGAR